MATPAESGWRDGEAPARRSRTAGRLRAGFAALVAIMGFAVAVVAYGQSGGAALRQTIAIDGQLWRVLSAFQDAETGQRGYLLTGDDAYLAPYARAMRTVDATLADLGRQVDGDLEQQGGVAELRELAGAKFAELDATIARRRAGDMAAVAQVVGSGAGRLVMDRIRARILSMQEREAALLAARQTLVERVAWAAWGILAVFSLLLAVLAASAVQEASRRASLSRFLPEELAIQLADGDATLQTGRRQTVAVAFVDIRNSTGLAEGMDPLELSTFLTDFRRRIIRIARGHGGVVDKFIGDGALVVFGLPATRPDDAARALAFAVDIVAVIARWGALQPIREPAAIGVGVHYGEVFCGIVGEDARREFTVLGDTVNVAARLESATKQHGVPVLVSEAAWSAAGRDAGWHLVSDAPLPGRRQAMPYLTPNSSRS